jgi:hypothetical protein
VTFTPVSPNATRDPVASTVELVGRLAREREEREVRERRRADPLCRLEAKFSLVAQTLESLVAKVARLEEDIEALQVADRICTTAFHEVHGNVADVEHDLKEAEYRVTMLENRLEHDDLERLFKQTEAVRAAMAGRDAE